jgi:hypothetical protein
MAKEIKGINISNTPDLLRLAEEVRKDNRAVVLISDGEEVARLSPLSKLRRAHTESDPVQVPPI